MTGSLTYFLVCLYVEPANEANRSELIVTIVMPSKCKLSLSKRRYAAQFPSSVLQPFSAATWDHSPVARWHPSIATCKAFFFFASAAFQLLEKNFKATSDRWKFSLNVSRLLEARRWPRKSYAFLRGGHLDFESAVIARNDKVYGSFHSSYSRLLKVKT